MRTITYPPNVTFFIVWNDDKSIVVYDFLTRDQEMSTGLDNIFQTENKEEFIEKLITDFNIKYIEP